MAAIKDEKRKLHSLRKHIDELLASGAIIEQRNPLTLYHRDQTYRVKQGMLVSYLEIADLIEPIADHDWPDALRKVAVDICLRQLDQALRAVEGTEAISNQPASPDSTDIAFRSTRIDQATSAITSKQQNPNTHSIK